MIEIIKRPLLTEKATKLQIHNQYVFEVDKKANKIQIKKAIEELFEVNVRSVRTAQIKGKRKFRYTRKGIMRGKTRDYKKAYVTLNEGETIDLVGNQ